MHRCAGEINIYQQDRSLEINTELRIAQGNKRKEEEILLFAVEALPGWPFPQRMLGPVPLAIGPVTHMPQCPSLSSLLPCV